MDSFPQAIGPRADGNGSRSLLLICHGLNAILLFSMTGLLAWYWDDLPAQVPVHFGAGGLPDRWTDKGGEFISLFVIPWIITGMLYGFSRLTPWFRKNPRWLNIPNKKMFLLLPPERQAPFFALLDFFYASMAVAVNLVFLGTITATIQVALGKMDRLPWWAIWPALGLAFVVAIANTVWMMVVVRRNIRG
jgi:hypothetical protein